MKQFGFVDKSLAAELETVAIRKHFPAGEILMNPGDTIRAIPVVLSGTLRIVLQNEKGNEHFLYHIFPGESCAMSLTCCASNKKSEIKAVVEDEADLLMIPVEYVDQWSKYPEWRKFISDTQAQRFTELLETIELISFSKLDEQIWDYLLKRVQASGSRTLQITHQEIATELNSPREVITRLLHQLREKGLVRLGRNTIEVTSQK
jgi:CRP/FNR family transcriptional regulator